MTPNGMRPGQDYDLFFREGYEAAFRLARRIVGETAEAEDVVAVRQALVAALRALPQRQREAVALRYLGDLTLEEVAAALGMATGTVKSHLHRGVASLRRTIGTSWFGGVA